MLALLLWDIGKRTQMPVTNWLARCFAVTFIAELLHVVVTLDWFGALGVIAASALEAERTTRWKGFQTQTAAAASGSRRHMA